MLKNELIPFSFGNNDLANNKPANITSRMASDLILEHNSKAKNQKVVNFDCTEFETIVKRSLNLSDHESITNEDMLRIEKLDIFQPNLKSLSGIEFASNLKSLFIRRSSLNDLTPLRKLYNLEVLFLGLCGPIEYITDLKGLYKLRNLSLNSAFWISDFTPLAHLTNLKTLTLPNRSSKAIEHYKIIFKNYEKIKEKVEKQISESQIDFIRESLTDCEINFMKC